MIKVLWPICNSLHMLNDGTVSSPAHITSVLVFSRTSASTAGTTVDTVIHTLPACLGKVVGNRGTHEFSKSKPLPDIHQRHIYSNDGT